MTLCTHEADLKGNNLRRTIHPQSLIVVSLTFSELQRGASGNSLLGIQWQPITITGYLHLGELAQMVERPLPFAGGTGIDTRILHYVDLLCFCLYSKASNKMFFSPNSIESLTKEGLFCN